MSHSSAVNKPVAKKSAKGETKFMAAIHEEAEFVKF
jgi:hypothetical protein